MTQFGLETLNSQHSLMKSFHSFSRKCQRNILKSAAETVKLLYWLCLGKWNFIWLWDQDIGLEFLAIHLNSLKLPTLFISELQDLQREN